MSRVGILTPMANPTVEAELRRLLPPEIDYVVARLVSDSADPAERLVAYAREAGAAVNQFGGMTLAALGFACTGSSYLIHAEESAAIAAAFALPFLFAADAAAAELERRAARRIALVSPYPPPLHAAACAWWEGRGFALAHEARVEIGSADTRAIYRLSGAAAEPAVTAALAAGPDAVLLSGTGMPSLDLLRPDDSIPVLSSNFCLAATLIRAAGAAR